MHHRRPGHLSVIVGLAAAVGLAVLGCTDDTGDWVALVPPDSWLATARISHADTEVWEAPEEERTGVAVVAPVDSADQLDQMVYVERLPGGGMHQLEGSRPVEVGALSGEYTAQVSGRRWAMLQFGDGRHSVALRAIEGTNREVLVDLAAVIDLDRPLVDQDWGPAWVPVALWDGYDGQATHRIEAAVAGDASVTVATVHGFDESVIHARFDIFLHTPVQVRGRSGIAVRYDGSSQVVLSWNEAPGVAVSLWVNSLDDDPLAHALRIAESLERADEAEWQRLIDRAGGG